MNNLQWALVLLGILVVAGVFLYSRGLSRPERLPEDEGDSQSAQSDPWEELLSDEGLEEREMAMPDAAGPHDASRADDEPAGENTAEVADEREQQEAQEESIRMHTPPPGEEKLVVLHVASTRWLAGEQVHAALKAGGLRFGPRRIYHRTEEVDGAPESVFCVANMLKPGYLDPENAHDLRTRGLSLFMLLPGPLAGAKAYRELLHTAGELAERLDGEVLDDKKTLLNKQMAQYLHEEVVEFERRRALSEDQA